MENRCLFKAKTARIVDSFNNAEDGIEVIGNIFDNPELLEV